MLFRSSFANAVFSGGIYGLLFRVSASCKKAIEDFKYIKEDTDGSKIKQMWLDPETGIKCQRWGHLSDAFDYFLPVAFRRQYDDYIHHTGGKYKSREIFGRTDKFGY